MWTIIIDRLQERTSSSVLAAFCLFHPNQLSKASYCCIESVEKLHWDSHQYLHLITAFDWKVSNFLYHMLNTCKQNSVQLQKMPIKKMHFLQRFFFILEKEICQTKVILDQSPSIIGVTTAQDTNRVAN